MPSLLKICFSAAILSTVFLARAADPAPAPSALTPLTVEDFARAPLMSGVTLSPDGARYAATVNWEGDRRGIVVMDINKGKRIGGLRGTTDLDVYNVFWHGNDRLLFQISKENIYAYGLFSAPVSKLESHIAIEEISVLDIIGQPRARPDRLLIWTRGGLLDELRVTRKYKGISKSRVYQYPDIPGQTLAYASDHEGELSFGIGWKNDTPSLFTWNPANRSWAKPIKLDLGKLWAKATDYDPAYVWVSSNDSAGSHLRRMKLSSGELESPVYTDRTADLDAASLVFSRSTRSLVGLRFSRSRVTHVWFDPAYAAIQSAIEAALPEDEDHRIIESDAASRRFLVTSQGPRQPGVVHVYDRDTGKLTLIAEHSPHLSRDRLRPATSVSFTSRDGLTIHGYLTLPAGVSKLRPAPLIVLPHGGPVARDYWSYDDEVQFLASRGYAVLQPNYRASYGFLWPDFAKTVGDFEGMQNDVIDATRSALLSGFFDDRRVAIMGSSFGGYLALACSAEEPDLFCAAISFAGVFDWGRLLKKIEPIGDISAGFEIWRQRLGDPQRDQARFEQISVLSRLDRLKAPVLLAHGRLDRNVGYEQTERLAKALRARNHPHQVHYYNNAAHGLRSEKDRAAYFREVESFLARHLVASSAP